MDNEDFASRLSELIVDNLTSVSQVGAESGCSEPNLSRYVCGRAMPSLDITIRLADYFNVTCDYLLGLDDESNAESFKPCSPFNKRFSEVLKELNVSRYRLQKLTGISESVMRYWAEGKTLPSVKNVIRVAQSLGCTVDYLLGREK